MLPFLCLTALCGDRGILLTCDMNCIMPSEPHSGAKSA